MHQYRIQYQSFLNTWNLKEVVVKSNDEKKQFVYGLSQWGWWLDDKTWLAPGCIQNVVVIS